MYTLHGQRGKQLCIRVLQKQQTSIFHSVGFVSSEYFLLTDFHWFPARLETDLPGVLTPPDRKPVVGSVSPTAEIQVGQELARQASPEMFPAQLDGELKGRSLRSFSVFSWSFILRKNYRKQCRC